MRKTQLLAWWSLNQCFCVTVRTCLCEQRAGGTLLLAVHGLLIAVTSRVAEHRL